MCRCQGGGLQDDGAPYSTAPYRLRYRPQPQAVPYGSCSGVFPFVFFFERTATLLQHKDPAAASYCKWAARALFRRIDPYNDFANVNAHSSTCSPCLRGDCLKSTTESRLQSLSQGQSNSLTAGCVRSTTS